MIDADAYLKGLEERLASDGCTVTHEKLGLVGYKAQMRALVRAHVFLVAAKAGRVDETTWPSSPPRPSTWRSTVRACGAVSSPA
jgi:hypothetical protein